MTTPTPLTHGLAPAAEAPDAPRGRTLVELRGYFGADHVNWVASQPNPVGVCVSRGHACWYANLLDDEAAYFELAEALRSEVLR